MPDERELWRGSPFYWIKQRPSRQVGAIGEKLVEYWATQHGFTVEHPLNSGHDRRINGVKVEIKLSTLWTNDNSFRFQQLRDQDYDYVFLLGIAPFAVHTWFVPKWELTRTREPHFVPQHTGKEGRETRWLSFTLRDVPEWLAPYGPRPDDVLELIRRAGSAMN